jgi:dipeptide/tripeptide permease
MFTPYMFPVTVKAVLFPCVYTVTYAGLLLGLAVFALNRRELP